MGVGGWGAWRWGTEDRQKQEEEEKKEKMGVCGGTQSIGVDGTAFLNWGSQIQPQGQENYLSDIFSMLSE